VEEGKEEDEAVKEEDDDVEAAAEEEEPGVLNRSQLARPTVVQMNLRTPHSLGGSSISGRRFG